MEKNIIKRTALISGASSGIGWELADFFANDGYDLVLIARNLEKLNEKKSFLETKFGITVKVIAKDLSNTLAPEEIYDELNQSNIDIDVLVNNAGIGDFGEFSKSDWSKLNTVIELNINSLTHLTRLFLPKMIERKSGKILNVSSIGGFEPGPLMAVYYASKAYVLSFSEAISRELKKTGVTVTALCPGPTRTDFARTANYGMSGAFVNLHVADAKSVAKYGYKKMNKGTVVAVHGFFNKLAVFGVKILPRQIVRNTVYKIQKNR